MIVSQANFSTPLVVIWLLKVPIHVRHSHWIQVRAFSSFIDLKAFHGGLIVIKKFSIKLSELGLRQSDSANPISTFLGVELPPSPFLPLQRYHRKRLDIAGFPGPTDPLPGFFNPSAVYANPQLRSLIACYLHSWDNTAFEDAHFRGSALFSEPLLPCRLNGPCR